MQEESTQLAGEHIGVFESNFYLAKIKVSVFVRKVYFKQLLRY